MKNTPSLDALAEAQPSSIEARLLRILRASRGPTPREIPLDAAVGEDLGIDGDDAVELFESLKEEFHTDFSSLQWNRHFGPEAGLNPLRLLKPSAWRTKLLPVTVGHLLEAARSGRWQYPNAESSSDGL